MKFGDAEFTRETARLLFEFGRFCSVSAWKFWRMRRRARRAVIFAPIGVRLASRVFAPPVKVLYRARIQPGSRVQISMADPRRGKSAGRNR